MRALFVFFGLGIVHLAAQPFVTYVLNAASQIAPGLPNSVVAPGSLLTIAGLNLGPAQAAQQTNTSLQTSLAGTSVQIAVNGATVATPVISTSSSLVTVLIPSTVPTGSGAVTVTFNGLAGGPAPVQVASSGFGIFTTNQQGSGPAQVNDSSNNPINLFNAAQPGQSIVLLGTGLGPTSTGIDWPPPMDEMSSEVSVYVGMELAAVQHAGRSGNQPGEDEIVFTIPSDAITGCYVPVAVVINNTTSNFATIPVAGGSLCSDPNGLSNSQMQILAANPQARVASLTLFQSSALSADSMSTLTFTTDTATATFEIINLAQYLDPIGFSGEQVSPGACLVIPSIVISPVLDPSTFPKLLNAGPSLALIGPDGITNLVATNPVGGSYLALASAARRQTPFLDAGTYTLSGTGGADVPPFQVQFQMPPPVSWAIAGGDATINRGAGLTVNWSGGDPNGFVTLGGISASPLILGPNGFQQLYAQLVFVYQSETPVNKGC